MTTTEQKKTVPVWNGTVKLNFNVKGSGPAVVYFHPAAGFGWDPFLEKLSQDYTVYSPEFPGTTPGNPYDIHKVDNLADAIFLYEEGIRALNLESPIAIGQSFGGMMALELAAAFPGLFSKVVVLDPIGLWRDEAPVTNWIAAPASELPAILFKDPSSSAAQAMLAMPEDPEALAIATAQLIWNLGSTGKFVWPIPDCGLEKRLHRITAPTLVIWGEDDALISSSYAALLGDRIKASRVEIVKDCGHIPQVEKTTETLAIVEGFLDVRDMAA